MTVLADAETVIALLDPPGPRSFAMLGFISMKADGSLRVRGVKDKARVSAEDLETLLVGGHALDISHLGLTADGSVPLSLGFVGVQVPQDPPTGVPPGAWKVNVGTTEGWVWLSPPAVLYGLLERWTTTAAHRAIARKDPALASAAAWGLSSLPAARAALWWTASDDKARGRALTWDTRSFAKGQSLGKLAATYREIVDRVLAEHGRAPRDEQPVPLSRDDATTRLRTQRARARAQRARRARGEE